MRLLIDTHLLIWSVAETDKLSPRTKSLLRDTSHERMFSAVSIWEIAIKTSLKKPDFRIDPRNLLASVLEAGFLELAISARASARVADLPRHHGDPFDRLLVAQAMDEGAVLLTADTALAAYGPHVMTLS